MVRAWGLEPQRREAREPKGDVTLVKCMFNSQVSWNALSILAF